MINRTYLQQHITIILYMKIFSSLTYEILTASLFPFQFQALQSMVQSNPQILQVCISMFSLAKHQRLLLFWIRTASSATAVQPMLQKLGKQNPQLLRLIQEHHAEFLQLINEPLKGSEG